MLQNIANNLERLSDDVLMTLKNAVEIEINKRYDDTLRLRSEVSFEYKIKETGVTQTITGYVQRLNPKTVSVVENYDSVNPGRRWKVSRSALKVKPVRIYSPHQPKPTQQVRSSAPSAEYTNDIW